MKFSVVLGLDANENRELNKNSYGDMVEGLGFFPIINADEAVPS